jgi:hypothetical protein
LIFLPRATVSEPIYSYFLIGAASHSVQDRARQVDKQSANDRFFPADDGVDLI